jgi:predicted aldo/keto reductase-like oxidoreductase
VDGTAVEPASSAQAEPVASASAAPADPVQAEPADTSVEQSDPPPMETIPKVPLGNSGLMVPMLAMGTGTAGWEGTSDQTQLGEEKFMSLMQHGFDRGASFLDLADLYGSHPLARLVLEQVPRDSVTVASKIWWREDGGLPPAREGRSEVERFLGELGTDYLDIVLIHSLLQESWMTDLAQMRDELSELKEEGIVRAVGCSCHTFATLRQAAEDPWVDVIFARVNPAGIRMDPDGTIDDINATLKLARANGKGVVGMKIYGDGGYAEETQRVESLRSAFQNGLVDAVTIGHLTEAQFDDTVAKLTAALS